MLFSAYIDLIILDVTLPDGNGVSLCQEWRDQGITTSILFLTAKDEEFDVVRGLDAGGNDYVTKPFRMMELLTDGDESDALAPEVHLCVEAGLDVVAPDAAQVFGDHHADQAGINVRNKLLPSRAFEVAAAEAIICVVPAMGETVVCRIRGQVRFL